MSAAAVIEISRFPEPSSPLPSPDEQLRDLIHDLRQPLSSIEAIAYYLEMTLPADQVHARLQMTHLQDLVQQVSEVLERSAAVVRKPCARAQSAGV